VSPSRTGIRIFIRGKLPANGRKKGPIEVYDRDKFLSVTGHRLTDHGAGDGIADRPAELLAWHREVFGDAPTNSTKEKGGYALVINNPPQLDEGQLDRLIQAKPPVRELFEGGHDKPSQSEADMALANYATAAGWTAQETCDLLVTAPQNAGEPIKHKSYFERTIAKARNGKPDNRRPGPAVSTPESGVHPTVGIPESGVDPTVQANGHPEVSLAQAMRGVCRARPVTEFKVSDKCAMPPRPPDGRTLYTAAELVAMDLPEPECIIEGILTCGLNIIASRPKLGKSWFALLLSMLIARKGFDVLYLALEDTRRRLKSRLLKLLGTDEAPEHLFLATEWSRLNELGKEGVTGKDAIIRWITTVENPRLIVLDTLAKVRQRSGDKYADDYQDVAEIKAIADEHDIGILAIHHVRKLQAEDIFDEVTGTIGITAATDTILVLCRARGQCDAVLHVTGRDLDESEIALSWDPDTCRWSVLGNAAKYQLSKERQEVIDIIGNGSMTPKEVAACLGKKANAVKKLLWTMANEGQLKSDGGRYSIGNLGNPVTPEEASEEPVTLVTE
jgi:hypothetical protein